MRGRIGRRGALLFELLREVAEFVLGKAHGGGLVAEDGIRRAIERLAQLREILGDAVLRIA